MCGKVTYPDVAKDGAIRALAVPLEILRDNGRDGHCDANEAVVVYADPNDVEPRQAALGGPPGSAIAATAGGEPVDGHDPGLDGAHLAEKGLLRVQVGGDIVAEEGEEGGNGQGLVAVGDDLEVDGVPVPLDLAKRRDGVDGHHEEQADDAGETSQRRHEHGVPERKGLTIAVHEAACSCGRA